LLRPNWNSNRYVRQFFQRNRPGQKSAFGPVLVISSEIDPRTPIAAAARTVAQMCKRGDRVQFHPDQDPNPEAVIGNSVQDQIAWMRARFAGARPSSDCR
jgi:hypothetical protein